jgi:hypothetical protein
MGSVSNTFAERLQADRSFLRIWGGSNLNRLTDAAERSVEVLYIIRSSDEPWQKFYQGIKHLQNEEHMLHHSWGLAVRNVAFNDSTSLEA